LKMLMFLYFEILYIFGVFELLENMCHTTRAIGQTLKKKENYYWYFENECHTVRATGQTLKEKDIFFLKISVTRCGRPDRHNKIKKNMSLFFCFYLILLKKLMYKKVRC